MRTLPVVTSLSILFLATWISLCSLYVKEVNVLTTIDDQKFEISEISQFDSSSPSSQGLSGNKVRKVSINKNHDFERNKSQGNLLSLSDLEADKQFLSLSLSDFTRVALSSNFFNLSHRLNIHILNCIWRV